MKKQVYETPEITVVNFDTADVITTSGICALAAGRGSGTTPGSGDVSGGAASETGGSGCEGNGAYDCIGSWNLGGCSAADGSMSGERGCGTNSGSNGGVG